jgi:tripartite-type tricarboxylate transporter receptor subunit TctC
MSVSRRTLLAAAALSAPALGAARAQGSWPSRPVRLVSPYAAGGASDISLRVLAERLTGVLGQQCIVENKPGAGTRLANEMVARAEPDGHTFLYAAAPYALAEALYSPLRYDPRKDLLPIAMTVLAPLFLIVNADSPAKTVADFVALAKSKPDGVTFGSPGPGSQPHLAGELLFKDAGIKGLTVQFRGDAPAYSELLAGRIDATITAITSALQLIEAGKLRVLGVASAERSPLFPAAPTLQEQGLSRVVAAGWYGFMAPAGTPEPIRARLEAETMRAVGESDVRQRFAALGLEARSASAAAFGRFIEEETTRWSGIIKDTGITVTQ